MAHTACQEEPGLHSGEGVTSALTAVCGLIPWTDPSKVQSFANSTPSRDICQWIGLCNPSQLLPVTDPWLALRDSVA